MLKLILVILLIQKAFGDSSPDDGGVEETAQSDCVGS